MEFDSPLWLLIVLPLVFAAGWVVARFDLRQWRDASHQTSNDYFCGLNYLLNEQQDQAIDAFIKAVQNDPDTTELHFALGNLFRRRAEYLRAGLAHQHLLARADISQADRERAQFALAQDYIQAGTIDYAEEILQQLQSTRFATEANVAQLRLYERVSEWPKANALIAHMHAQGQGDFSARQAHYLCEQAQALLQADDIVQAQALLTQAITCAPQAARARLSLAQLLHHHLGQSGAALELLLDLAQAAPSALPLAAPLLVTTAQATGRSDEILTLLRTHYQVTQSLDLLDAVVALEGDGNAQQHYLVHMEQAPSLMALARWLEYSTHTLPAPAQRALDTSTHPLTRYRCAACGFQSQTYLWRCFSCQKWDTYPVRRVEDL